MNNLPFSRVLVLSPHTDDGEFGCGASISRFLDDGIEIYYAVFSLAEESVPSQYPKNILGKEVKKATRALGIDKDNLMIYKYPVRRFSENRQDILENLVQLNKEIDPDLVFMPCLEDLHQDHSTIAKEGLRAFKMKSILGYEIPWNNINFSTRSFIVFNKIHLDRKLSALSCYESQKHRHYASKDFITSLARTRGTQIGVKYAEVFEVIRWIL